MLPADEPETFGHFSRSPSNPATPTSQDKGRNPSPGHMRTEPDPEATHATSFLGSTQDRQMHGQSRLTAGLGGGGERGGSVLGSFEGDVGRPESRWT